MQSENRWRKSKKDQSQNIVWLTAFLLAVLVVVSISIIGTSLYNYVHRSDCQISLYDGQVKETAGAGKTATSKNASNPVVSSQAVKYSGEQARQQSEASAFDVEDAEQVWKTETAIELFQTEYKNTDGTITVQSADGKHVVAPGTEGIYTFSLKNTSNASADYKIWVEAKLSSNMEGVPLQTRMSGSEGWLLGSRDSWELASALDGVATEESIDAGKSAEYTIYWQWPFEQDQDAEDTALGDASVDQEMSYTVTIYTLTSAAAGSDSQENQNKNGIGSILHLPKTGDQIQIFVWAVVLIAAAEIFLILFILKKRKNDGKHEQNKSKEL